MVITYKIPLNSNIKIRIGYQYARIKCIYTLTKNLYIHSFSYYNYL